MCFTMGCLEEMFVLTRKSSRGGGLKTTKMMYSLNRHDGTHDDQDYVMFTTKVRLFEKFLDPQSDLQAVNLWIPVKLHHKDKLIIACLMMLWKSIEQCILEHCIVIKVNEYWRSLIVEMSSLIRTKTVHIC